jgi:hypothetical protein
VTAPAGAPAGAPARAVAWARAHPRAAVAAALLLVPAVLLREALLGGVLYQRDVHLYWHPEAEAFVRSVVAGAWPSWDPGLGFGQPFLANASAQVLYPPTWLNLLMPPWRYYTLFVFAHLAWSAAGTYAAARRLEASRTGALVGAMTWTAAGPFVSLTILWHHFAGAAWLPWVAAAALRLGAAPTMRSALALAAALGAQQLAGSFDMSAMGAFVATAAVTHALARRTGPGTPRIRLALLGLGAATLAAGLSAGQWMATLEVAAHSGRRALPRDVRTYWSVHPAGVPDLVLPGFSAGVPVPAGVRREMFEGREPFLASLYLGLAAGALALAAFTVPRQRGIALVLAAAAALALLVALGRHGPAYDALVAIVPPLRAFRYPVKVTILVALPWSLLAALGFDAWRGAQADPGAMRRIARLALAVALFGGLAAGTLYGLGARRAAAQAGLASVLAALSAGATLRGRGAGVGLAPAAVAAVVAVADLVLYHRSVNAVAPPALYTHRPEVLRHLGTPAAARVYAYDYSVRATADTPVRAAPRLARAPEGWALGPATALAQQLALTPVAGGRWGLRGSFEVDYTGMFPVHVNQAAYLLRALEGTPAHLRLLQLAGVTHVVALHADTFADLRPVAAEPGLYEADVRVFAVPDPMPRVFVAAASRAGEGIPGLHTLVDPAFDFRREVLVPATAPPAAGSGNGVARIVGEDPARMAIEVEAPAGGYLVVLDSYDPGWRATVDGRPAAIFPANVLFRGIRIEPGRHEVELAHRAPGQRAGLAVTIVSALGAGALAWRTRRTAAPPEARA